MVIWGGGVPLTIADVLFFKKPTPLFLTKTTTSFLIQGKRGKKKLGDSKMKGFQKRCPEKVPRGPPAGF